MSACNLMAPVAPNQDIWLPPLSVAVDQGDNPPLRQDTHDATGGNSIQKVQVDKFLRAHGVEKGGFLAHEVPSGLLTSNRAIDTDNTLRSVQQQQCARGLTLAKGFTNLNDVVAKLKQTVSEGQGLSNLEAQDLATELSTEASRPFSQAFRVVASKANNLHSR